MKSHQLNKKHKNRGWTITSKYMAYRADGGSLSPQAWNDRIKELKKKGKGE